MTDCAGVSDASTSAPTACSLIARDERLWRRPRRRRLRAARRELRAATSSTSLSLRRPRLARRAKIAPRRSLRASSNAGYPALRRGSRRCVGDRVADRLDLLGFLVGNVDVELGLERHDQLDLVERVGTQIVGDRRFGRDFGLVDAELLDDDLLDFIEGRHSVAMSLLALAALYIKKPPSTTIVCPVTYRAASEHKKRDDPADVVRRPGSAERHVRRETPSRGVGHLLGHGRFDEARRDGVDSYVPRTQFLCHRFVKPSKPALDAAYAACPAFPVMPTMLDNEDDRARRAASSWACATRRTEVERGLQVHVDSGRRRRLEAQDQRVDRDWPALAMAKSTRPNARDGPRRPRLDRRLVGHVGDDLEHARRAGPRDRPRPFRPGRRASRPTSATSAPCAREVDGDRAGRCRGWRR